MALTLEGLLGLIDQRHDWKDGPQAPLDDFGVPYITLCNGLVKPEGTPSAPIDGEEPALDATWTHFCQTVPEGAFVTWRARPELLHDEDGCYWVRMRLTWR